ncbi:hypothetical protein KVH27_19560 [Streptomyces olivaceus]|uniref:hypothetical protein n=1 Tax=Streptomyces olivaceus TaxID=47716 RepID=UPI001CC9ADEF|nr:hypothetical protein [Streptomyces olivaceus]MBZ6250566.1 hypothetical protein [Streptomyces olivaceus]
MQKRTLPRLAGAGWAHPYGHGPFAPYLYADGGDGDDSGSGSDDNGDEGDDGGQDDDAGGTGDDDTGTDDEGKGEKPKPKPPAKKDEDPAAELARLRKELKTANGEAAKARTTAKKAAADEARTEIMKELGKVLGLVEDDDKTPPDPAALKAQIESATAAHKSTAIELAVYRGAGKAGVDPDAITDSRAFMKSIEDLDPSDEGFAKAVTAAMKKAAEDNPKLKAASQAPARTSSDFSGSSEKPASKNSIEAQREARRKARNG